MKYGIDTKIWDCKVDEKGNCIPERSEIGIVELPDDFEDFYDTDTPGYFHSIEYCDSIEEAREDLEDFLADRENVTIIA